MCVRVCACVRVCVRACVSVSLGQAAVEAEGRSQGPPGCPSPGEFSDAQGGAWTVCFQAGWCGWLKLLMWYLGKLGYAQEMLGT